MTSTLNNSQWVRNALINSASSERWAANTRDFELLGKGLGLTQPVTWADTTIGGNRAINPKPQYTSYGDVPIPSVLPPEISRGMGRIYNDTHEAYAQRIFLQFGVPEYNSLTGFFSNFYDYSLGEAVNSGIIDNLLHTAGKVLGFITLWPVAIVLGATKFVRNIIDSAGNNNRYRYFYLRPTMNSYLNTVQTIFNGIATNMGFIGGYEGKIDGIPIDPDEGDSTFKATDRDAFAGLLPDVFSAGKAEDGGGISGIDILKVTNRYQRLNDHFFEKIRELKESIDPSAQNDAMLSFIRKLASGDGLGDYILEQDASGATIYKSKGIHEQNSASGNKGSEVIKSTRRSQGVAFGQSANSELEGVASSLTDAEATSESINQAGTLGDEQTTQDQAVVDRLVNEALDTDMTKWSSFLEAEAREGSSFICFNVDWINTVSESFSNTTTTSSIGDSMNNTSSEARGTAHNFAGGNVADNFVSNSIEGILGGLKSFVGGVASSVGMEGVFALTGKAFVDIPDHYESSSVELPENSYTMKLRTPYGHPYAVLTELFLPMCYILAGVAARTTGHNSYGAPYLCKLFSESRNQIDVGIIDKVTISRGEGTVGWSKDGLPTGIDITFSVKDLSNMLHIPIETGIGIGDLLGTSVFTAETPYTNYIASLAGQSLADRHHASRRWKYARARRRLAFDQYWSVNNFTSKVVNDGDFGGMIQMLYREGIIGEN